MWITDLHKATDILLDRGYNDLVIKRVCAGGRDILAIFFTTYHTKLVVYDSGLIAEYEVE
jgi:hypothetical protein